MRRWPVLFIALALIFACPWSTPFSEAKTLESAKAEKIFFYADNAGAENDGAGGAPVLIAVLTLDELKAISHGNPAGGNYYISSTDNYPTTQYCEARGLTIPEFVEYVASVTGVKGADKLSFESGDALRLMATDSYGNYNRSWTYDALYGEPRYYFEGLFKSWRTSWEVGSEDSSKFGLTLAEYNETYAEGDAYYAEKRAVFAGGVRTEPILATESFSGRTTTDTLVASTEPGIAEYITKNGGIAAGSLKDALTDETALRLALPMTEADLMAAHRTAFDNFKWTYNLKLELGDERLKIEALGNVAEPVVTARVSGDTLTFTISCATEGADIYYGFDGAPQTPYTGPVAMDVKDRDLAKDPATLYVTAVREGYSDAGIITVKYPGLAPAFVTLYSGIANSPLTFEANDAVSASDWSAWTGKLQFATMKAPGAPGYVRVDDGNIAIDDAERTVTFDAALFQEIGAYSFVFHASGFADKSANVTIKQPVTAVRLAAPATVGEPFAFEFDDPGYKDGASLYVTPPSGERVMLTRANLETYAPTEAGEYLLSFVNTKYEPSTIDLTVSVTDGSGLEFLFFGDIQVTLSAAEDYAAWAKLAKAALAANKDAAFALQSGDIVESGISAEQWDAFFAAKSEGLGELPFYPTVGNHESNFLSGKPEEYLKRFELPTNGPEGFEEEFYSFDAGNVHIAVLNSWIFSGEQKLTDDDIARVDAWVRNDLLGSRADWKIVLTHLPVYAVHYDANADKMREHWADIFEDCGVNLVLVGHQHVYSRLAPQNGVTQIMGNSGLKFYDSADETLAERTIYNISTYQTLTADAESLIIETFDADGAELDYIEITRPTRGAFRELHPELAPLFQGYGDGEMGWDDPITAEQIQILNERLIS